MAVDSPPALRARRVGWRDPRLAVGLLLVVGSVLLGARVLAAADDTVAVLAARGPLAAGQRLVADDLTSLRLRFADEAAAEAYLSPGSDLAGAVLLRPVGAGELVPRAALARSAGSGVVEVPLGLDPSRVPGSVQVGSTVDVWVLPDASVTGTVAGTVAGTAAGTPAGAARSRPARRLLGAVPVLGISRGGAGPSGLRLVVVGVPVADADRLDDLGAVLGDVGRGSLLLVRRPG